MRKNKLFKFLLFFLSVLLFALSQPSFVFEDGLSFCAWLAYIPFFLLLEHVSLKKSFFWGAAYGFLAYFCLCWWLSAFGAAAILFVCVLFSFYNAILFFLIVWSKQIFPQKLLRFFWIFRALLVLSVEFLRTHGIFAFSYGIIGYSQWRNPVFLRFSSLFGVTGVSFVILLINSLLAKILFEKNLGANLKNLSFSASLVAGILVFSLFPSIILPKRPVFPIQVALVQNASSAPSCAMSDYEKDSLLLQKLTDEALVFSPHSNLVVWPETAVVPDILYHRENTADSRRHKLSEEIFDYFKSKKCSFLIGSNHLDEKGTHNSALYFSPDSEKVGVYSKNRLVPFTEFWPSFLDFKIFDGIKDSLNCEFFAKGSGIEIFSIESGKSDAVLHFAAPICFEDSFPSLIREMKMAGADFFVNISDDAWSGCDAARNMHLSMSAFRCAEFSSPMLRSTIDGKTCVVGPDGKVVSEIESGIDSFLCAGVEVPKGSGSLYLVIGDLPISVLCAAIALFLLILSARFCKIKTYGRR